MVPARFVVRVVAFACAMSVVLFFNLPARAQPTFTEQPVTFFSGSTTLFAADIDNDGDTDVIATLDLFGFDVVWYENDGLSPPGFTLDVISVVLDDAQFVFAADMNGDGDMDVVTASPTTNTLAWFENDGASPPAFTQRTVSTSAIAPVAAVAADMNGDGRPDILLASQTDGRLWWYENNGAALPTFSEFLITGTAISNDRVFAADVDGDGDIDALSATSTGTRIWWYENNGANPPGFTQRDISVSAINPDSIVTADMDGDGDTDVISALNGELTVAWFENDGMTPPGFTKRTVDNTVGLVVNAFAADVDGDGDTDVLSGSSNADKLVWHENDGQNPPGFTKHALPVTAQTSDVVFAADVDGDGNTDVLTASVFSGSISWHESSGASIPVVNVTAGTQHSSIPSAINAASSGDVIRSGSVGFAASPVLDLGAEIVGGKAIILEGAPILSQPTGGSYQLGDGDAILTSERRLQLGATSVLLAAQGDMDLEGEVTYEGDTVMAARSIHAGPSSSLSVGVQGSLIASAPDGAVLRGELILPANSSMYVPDGDLTLELIPPTYTERAVGATTFRAGTVRAGDVDGDGDVDAVATSQDHTSAFGGEVHWYESDGMNPPVFTRRLIESFISVTPQGVTLVDLDVDGDNDIVVALDGDQVVWYENDGMKPPSFTRSDISSSFPLTYSDVLAADVNGDGIVDVAVIASPGQNILWFQNDGALDPSFTQRTITAPTQFKFRLRAADMDGDTDIDFIVSNPNVDTVEWFENDGALVPSFTQNILSNATLQPYGIDPGDFDGDGDIDLIVAANNSSTFAWYENDGAIDPTFSAQVISTSLFDTRSVHAADMDDDGDTDILVSVSGFGSVLLWFENDGASEPQFARRTVATGLDWPDHIVTHDVNGDGEIDALVAENTASKIDWFQATPGPTTTISGFVGAAGTLESARPIIFNDVQLVAGAGITNRRSMQGFGVFEGSTTNERDLIVQSDLEIIGDYTNNGSTIIQNGTLTILGTLIDNGTIVGDFAAPATAFDGDRAFSSDGLFVENGHTAGPGSTLRFPNGGLVAMGGNLDLAIDDSSRLDLASATIKMTGLAAWQTLEVMSTDIGADALGLDRTIAGHYPIGTLRIGPTSTTVNLVDAHDNDGQGQTAGEGVYVDSLIIGLSTALNTNGFHIYYNTLTNNGTVDDPANLIQIITACPGDANGDGTVNFADITNVLANWLNDYSPATGPGDADNDGVVNFGDITAVLGNWLALCP